MATLNDKDKKIVNAGTKQGTEYTPKLPKHGIKMFFGALRPRKLKYKFFSIADVNEVLPKIWHSGTEGTDDPRFSF